jgi:hypothetical protein
MTSLKSLLRDRAQRYRIAEVQLQVSYTKEDEISASIDIPSWVANIEVPRVKFSAEVADRLSEFIINHEFGHWRYCPRDIAGWWEIRKAVDDALKDLGLNLPEAARDQCVNIFADFVDNIANIYSEFENKNAEKYREGLRDFFLFTYKRGEFAFLYDESRRVEINLPTLLLINVFQFFFMPDKNSRILQEEELAKVEYTTEKIAKILLGDLSEKYSSRLGSLSSHEKHEIVMELLNREKWYYKAKEITKYFAPLMVNGPTAVKTFDVIGMPAPGSSKIDLQQLLSDVDKLFPLLDKIYREETRNNKVTVVKSPERELWQPKVGSELYTEGEKDLASKIANRDISPRDIKWIRNELVSLHRRENFESSQFKRLVFIVDSSSSMSWGSVIELAKEKEKYDPMQFYQTLKDTALNKGEYDYLVRAFYSFIGSFQKSGALSEMRIGIINFSGATVWSGWRSGSEQDLHQLKRFLFAFQNGGTTLDIGTVKQVYGSVGEPVLTVLISDGDLSNTDEVLASLAPIWKRSPFVFLSTRNKGEFAKQLEKRGLDVRYVYWPADLEKMILDFTNCAAEGQSGLPCSKRKNTVATF